jgi:plastocyanin
MCGRAGSERLRSAMENLRRYRVFLTVAAGALLIPAAAANAATKDMFAGTPPKGALPRVPGVVSDNAFYLKKVTIHQGDRVAFKTVGFHNILLAPKGKPAPELFALDPSHPVAGVKDAAGADFWFNGLPSVGINPQVAAPSGGNVYTGKELISSGVPAAGLPKPLKVKFPKKGSYTVLCALHPGMKGTIVVKAKKAKIPSAKQDGKRIKAQVQAATKLARKLAAGQGAPTGLTVRAGNDKQGIAALAFFPADKTVKVGQSVNFTVSDRTTESHNIAFAPQSYAQELAGAFIGPAGLDPRTVYPSEAPGSPLVVNGTSHGNGYVNTGMLDSVKSTPLPKSATVSFSQPGTYQYYCIVHGAEMSGKITVTQ